MDILMPGIEVVPFRASDLLEFQPRAEGTAPPIESTRAWRLGLQYQQEGPAFTMRVDGRVVACAGVVLRQDGLATAWLVASEDIRRYRFTLYKRVKRELDSIMRYAAIQRVQTILPPGFPDAKRWLECLGFRRDDDYQVYSRSA